MSTNLEDKSLHIFCQQWRAKLKSNLRKRFQNQKMLVRSQELLVLDDKKKKIRNYQFTKWNRLLNSKNSQLLANDISRFSLLEHRFFISLYVVKLSMPYRRAWSRQGVVALIIIQYSKTFCTAFWCLWYIEKLCQVV